MVNCRTGWKRFERDDNGTVVCMKIFPLFNEGGQAAAMRRCQQDNVTLSGIASMEEAEWVRGWFLVLIIC